MPRLYRNASRRARRRRLRRADFASACERASHAALICVPAALEPRIVCPVAGLPRTSSTRRCAHFTSWRPTCASQPFQCSDSCSPPAPHGPNRPMITDRDRDGGRGSDSYAAHTTAIAPPGAAAGTGTRTRAMGRAIAAGAPFSPQGGRPGVPREMPVRRIDERMRRRGPADVPAGAGCVTNLDDPVAIHLRQLGDVRKLGNVGDAGRNRRDFGWNGFDAGPLTLVASDQPIRAAAPSCARAAGPDHAARRRCTSLTRSFRWKGFDSTLASRGA